MEAFQLALRLGATGLESDVWLTGRRRAGARPRRGRPASGRRSGRIVGRYRRDELPEHIPSLAELIATCGTGYELSLDLKDPGGHGGGRRSVRAASLPNCSDARGCATPTSRAGRAAVARRRRCAWSTRPSSARMKEGPERRAAVLADAAIDAVNLHHSQWTGGLTTLFHRFDRVAFAWDLQFEHVLRNVAADGHRRRVQRPRRRDDRRPQGRVGSDDAVAGRRPGGRDCTNARSEPLPVAARPEHHEGASDEVVLADRPEGAAVLRAAAVVAHHEDVVLRDGHRGQVSAAVAGLTTSGSR